MNTTTHFIPEDTILSDHRRGRLHLALSATLLVLSALLPAHAQPGAQSRNLEPGPNDHDDPRRHPHLGMWVTADGQIRHELLPNGRYDEQRGQRKHAYQGRYWVKGNQISYLDDTGFTADGEFRDNRFLHGGYVFFREQAPASGGR